MILGSKLIQPALGGVLSLVFAALALSALGIACGTGASPPPIATVPPPTSVAQAPVVAPTATVIPAAAVAPANVPPTFEFPATRTPRPTPTPIPRADGDMTQAVLFNHTATLLEDGRVLVTGGQTRATDGVYPPLPPRPGVVSAEIYDPSTGRWSPTSPMSDPRTHHDAVMLEDGKVLVSGGLTDEFTLDGTTGDPDYVFAVASAEVYDPSTETWSGVGEMPEETVDFIGTQNNRPAIMLEMLKNGKVLAVGGLGPSAALFDVSSGKWAASGEASSPVHKTRQWHTSTLVGNGKVLYIGGWTGSAVMDSVELYDPLTGSSSPTGGMIGGGLRPTAAVLPDGRVLVTGGYSRASAEVYDPLSSTWSETGAMATPRMDHTITLLRDGRVLVVGGSLSTVTEIYDPSTGVWSKASDLLEPRVGHTATLLRDGRVLVAGGASGTGRQPFPSTSAEVYDPVADTWTLSTEAAR